MHLEKIEIQGFKSFAERTILEFLPGTKDKKTITIIVGPNGSGKSNISDAIKWVLGEQSMKNIRGKKSEDVIFSGSEKRSKLGFAEVSLYLNNEDKVIDLDYDHLVLTRRLYRDGQSEYLLNKNPVRLFDIQLMLAKAHFGQKSFSIISQGMVDSVLMATPLERKEFFDEAVGVKEFQIKRHQSLNKLERTEDNLNQAGLLIKELSPQLRSLTRQVKRLEKREQVQATLRDYQHEYYHRLWSEFNKIKSTQSSQIAKLQTDLDSLKEQLEGKREQLDAIEKQEKRGQIFQDLQLQLQEKNDKRNRLLRELTILKGRQEINLEKQGKLDLAWLYRQEEAVTSRIVETEKELAVFKKEHNSVSKQQQEKQQLLDQLKNKIDALTLTISQQKENLSQEAHKNPLATVLKKVKEVSLTVNKFFKRLSKASADQLAQLQATADTIDTSMRDLENLVQQHLDGIQKEEEATVSESQELWDLQQDLNRLIDEHERINPEINQLEIKAQVLQEKQHLKLRDHEQLKTELERISKKLSEQQRSEKGTVDNLGLEKEQAKTEKILATLQSELNKLQEKLDAFNEEQEAKQSQVFKLEREYQDVQQQVNRLQQKQHTIQVELARTETKLEDLETEIKKELGEPTIVHKRPEHTNTDLETLPTERLFSQIEKAKYQLELIGGIDPETVAEYEQIKERHDFLSTQVADLDSTINKLEQVITELDKTITRQFDQAFNKINKEFERYFQILFGGGRAKLIKVVEDVEAGRDQPNSDENQPTEDGTAVPELKEEKQTSRAKKYKRTDLRGIDIYASPAGKKLSTVNMLSGGERSLTSLALIAAIIHNNPSPFIMLDEVDAALDEANSQRMAKVLENLREHSQFIIITHNRTIMTIADSIYGVTMGQDGVSKLLSVKLEDVDQHTTRL